MKSSLQPSQLFGISSHVGAIARSMVFIALSVVVTNSMAWGTEGHQVIAAIAQAQLTTKARTEVNRLLALEPGETLQSISTWPDEHRGAATGSWHYVNFPRETCTYDAGRDCPDGNCVVGGIAKQLEILASNASDDTRIKALKYVVHFVADVHQPLLAGYFDDRRGQQVSASGIWAWQQPACNVGFRFDKEPP